MAVTPLEMLQAMSKGKGIADKFDGAPYTLPENYFGSQRTPAPRGWGVIVMVDLADIGPSQVFIPQASESDAIDAAQEIMAQATDDGSRAMGLDDATTTLWVRAELVLAAHAGRG